MTALPSTKSLAWIFSKPVELLVDDNELAIQRVKDNAEKLSLMAQGVVDKAERMMGFGLIDDDEWYRLLRKAQRMYRWARRMERDASVALAKYWRDRYAGLMPPAKNKSPFQEEFEHIIDHMDLEDQEIYLDQGRLIVAQENKRRKKKARQQVNSNLD